MIKLYYLDKKRDFLLEYSKEDVSDPDETVYEAVEWKDIEWNRY